ncbi:MAG: tripartite tricarboxylate transporter substrate binding protein [Burkholderiales bacterium]|nr:tripartite tricarboxylate transporter substrate binding protein [Burkholderiales bacterium]
MSRVLARVLVMACALALLPASGSAQLPAQRPIRVLVSAAPGGAADVQIRLLLPAMSAALGQRLLVDNRASANDAAAAETAAKAAPDGHTLVVGNSASHALNAALYAHPAYDPIRDFAPISQLTTTGFVLTAHPRLPGKSIADLAAYARPIPGKLNVASATATDELAAEALWARLGIKTAKVRHKGSPPSIQALTAGEVDLSLLMPAVARPHLHAGRLKAYGITGADRSPVLPEVPTMLEQGLDDYEFPYWSGLFAPARTPAATVDALYKSVLKALEGADVRRRFEELGLTPVGNAPAMLAEVVKRDVAKYRKLIADMGTPRL